MLKRSKSEVKLACVRPESWDTVGGPGRAGNEREEGERREQGEEREGTTPAHEGANPEADSRAREADSKGFSRRADPLDRGSEGGGAFFGGSGAADPRR